MILQLKLVKNIQEEVKAELGLESSNGDDLIHGCKVLKELTEPWYHTHRLVCVDSYFSSVSTAKELMRLGVRFIGVVKTASKQFPMACLQELESDKRGEWKGLRNATTLLYVFIGLIITDGILILIIILCHTGPRTQDLESVRLRLLNLKNLLYGWNSP